MILTLVAVAVGLATGLARGGDLRRLGQTHVVWPALALVGLAIPTLVNAVDPPLAGLFVIAALAAVIGFAMANLHLTGMGVVAFGTLMNLAPLALNGYMPVSGEALVAVDLASTEELSSIEFVGPRQLQSDGDLLTFLGDIIPLGLTQQVMSFGDLVILIGIADVAANLVWTRRRKKQHRAMVAEEAVALILGEADQGDVINVTSPAQDWGTAPNPSAVSASQYSARPEPAAPEVVLRPMDAATFDRP